MATTYKVLGQAAPAAATSTSLYTVPSGTQAVVSTVTICNRSSGDESFRVSVRPGGAGESSEHFIAYDAPISANDTIALTIGMTLGPSDVVGVYSDSSNISFSAFGSEVA